MTVASNIYDKLFSKTCRAMLVALTMVCIVLICGCSSVVGPNPEDVVSISFRIGGFASQESLYVSSSTVRWLGGGQAQRYDHDTVVNDSIFLSELLRSVNLTDAINESDDVDDSDLANDGALFTVEISYVAHPGDETLTTKQIRFTSGPPDSIRDIAQAMQDRMRQIRSKQRFLLDQHRFQQHIILPS